MQLVPLMTHKDVTMMPISAAAAGSNDNVVNYIAQELVFDDKI